MDERPYDIEIPNDISESKIPKSFLDALSEVEKDIVVKVEVLENAGEWLLRIHKVRDSQMQNLHERVARTEKFIERYKPMLKFIYAIGLALMAWLVELIVSIIKAAA